MTKSRQSRRLRRRRQLFLKKRRVIRKTSILFSKVAMILIVMIFSELRSLKIKRS